MEIKQTINNQHLQWTISHPEKGNALGINLANKLLSSIKSLQASFDQVKNTDVDSNHCPRSLLIDADVSKTKNTIWIAGGNLYELASLKDSEAVFEYANTMSEVCRYLRRLPIPVIMCMHGGVIGGGAEFALAGDFRLMTKGSYFHFKQMDIGLSLGYASSRRLTQLLGESQTFAALFLKEKIYAQKALETGLIHGIAKNKDDLLQKANDLAKQINLLNPKAVAIQKEMIVNACPDPSADEEIKELRMFSSLWLNSTHKKFMKHYIESHKK